MSKASRIVTYYLHEQLRMRVEAKRHNFFNKLTDVLTFNGLDVELRSDTLPELIAAAERPGYSVVLMNEPVNERGVTVRLNYLYPFWHIERTAKRWEWPVALTPFDASQVDANEADRFVKFRRNQIFGLQEPKPPTGQGYVYIPLQGRLLLQRSFQSCSPIDMIRATLQQLPGRRVVVSLHPKEMYADLELEALHELVASELRLELRNEPMEKLLPDCDLVVAQNSSAALYGFFLHKPAVLFGRSNFHHIAGDVTVHGVAGAFDCAIGDLPDFDRYLCWFFRHMAVDAASDTVYERIQARLRRAGWPVDDGSDKS